MVDHALIGVNIAALQVDDVVLDLLCQGSVIACLPRPVRRGVMQTQEERLACSGASGHTLHVVHRVVRNQVRQIAFFGVFFLDAFMASPQVMSTGEITVREIVYPAGHRTEELFVAGLQRPKAWRITHVPLADQCGAVTAGAQERR